MGRHTRGNMIPGCVRAVAAVVVCTKGGAVGTYARMIVGNQE